MLMLQNDLYQQSEKKINSLKQFYFNIVLAGLYFFALHRKTGSANAGFTGIRIIKSEATAVQSALPVYFIPAR